MKVREEKLEAVVVGIKPMLDWISFELPKGMVLLLGDRPPRLILNRFQEVWKDFKAFTSSAAYSAVLHALTVLWSHYPSVKPKVIMIGYTRGTNLAKITKSEDEAVEATRKLAGDVDLFSEEGNNTQ